MDNKKKVLLFIFLVIIVAAYFVITLPAKLGLDLVGGSRLTLEAQTTDTIATITPDMMDSLKFAIEKRVNSLGVSEVVVQKAGERRLIIEIPDVSDPEQAKKYLGDTAELEFKEQKKLDDGTIEWVSTGLTGKDLKKSSVVTDAAGQWVVGLEFNNKGAQKFADLTKRLVGQPMAIFFNGELQSAPNIKDVITGGSAVISGGDEGGFKYETAKEMVDLLNAGALPVPAKIIEENVVGPTLGADSIDKSKKAAFVGLGLVAIFMLILYRVPGLIANIALAIYALIVFAIFKRIPVTLTLAGIAGFVLSIGMAVDANILIFERTKEELRSGKRLLTAVKTGFDRAFTSIFDSNMTTMITCAILYMYGTSIVRGFALTLAIGVAVSMFTAITVSRSLMEVFIGADHMKHPSWFGLKADEVSASIVEEQSAGKAKLGVLD
ncbi:MAG: protein translocase subunit SecD [bacterium]|nr:protein translocase subunit SecD [bacterium]